jgi:AraC family transcriptional regulator of adaptative response / DNA-3-methyladenine glycosylase II
MREPTGGLPGLDRAVLDRVRLSRDPRFDGRFFIAVETTGIFCRPICPSPTANARNVLYFATAASAVAAGFRPCLRCRPEAAPGTAAWAGTSAVVGRALRLIHDGELDLSSVATLAERVGIGARHLHRLFVQHVGASPFAVAQHRRVQFAKHLLDETDLPVGEIALAARFGSVRRFNDAFRRTYRVAPRELRRRRRGGLIRQDAHAITLELPFRPPYAWAELRGFLAERAIAGVERVDERGYWRATSAQAGHALVAVVPSQRRQALELHVQGAAPLELLPITATVRRVFDLSADPLLIAAAFEREPRLRDLVRRQPGRRIPGAWNAFECAVWALLEQQVGVAAARSLAARLVQRAGRAIASGADGLTHLFPGPEELAVADLAGLGIGDACAIALQALARAVVRRSVDLAAPAEELRHALAALPGLGAWGVEYVALRALGQPDAFPAADLTLRRAAAGGGRPLSTGELVDAAERFRPWRGYAAVHLWAAANAARHGEARGPSARRRAARRARNDSPDSTSAEPRWSDA